MNNIIEEIINRIKNETGAKVHLCDNNCPSSIEEVDDLLDNLIRILCLRLSRRTRKDIKQIILNGEIDFNQYTELTNKLMENGFQKNKPICIGGCFYDEYIVGDGVFKIIVPKSKT